VHSRSAGLDTLLFPALVDSPAVLTNARGVYSPALAEFAMAAVLYFAKGFPRMLGSQAEGKWDPFDLEPLAGRTMGIVGYGDIGQAVARKARAFDMRVIALRRRPEASAGDPLVDEALPLDPVVRTTLRFPAGDGATLAMLHEYGRVLGTRYVEGEVEVEAEVPESLRRTIHRTVENIEEKSEDSA